jgi:tRNA G18 (ribose-2'-O)-methylase SpoU
MYFRHFLFFVIDDQMNKQLNFQEIRTDATKRITNIKHNRLPIALLCDRMTDFRNIGAMFRIADAARLEKIYFYQSDANFEHKKISKVARTTNQYVDFEMINNLEMIDDLATEYEIIALDKTSKSIDYTIFQQKNTAKKLLLIIGAEKFGVSEELLQKSSTAIHLPMLGVNTSMNVSVATGIAVFKLLELIR